MTISRGLNSGKSRSNILATIAISLLFLSFASYLSAQSVSFSGTWAFNESKSTPAQGGPRFAPVLMVITQEGNNLTVERTSKGQNGEDMKTTSKFTLDGKECVNQGFQNSTRKSTVTWSADKKSLAFAHTMTFNENDMKFAETWKLNETDKTLAVETVFNGQDGEMKTTNVYDKK